MLEKALQGERQMVFVTGEAGVGKTALVGRFLAQIATERRLWVAQGQCIEHYGAGEAYMPVLEALGRLCRGPDHTQVLTLLRQYAPTWLLQLPAVVSAPDFKILRRKVAGATKERMLRELAEAIEVLTAERGLILVLKDLPWSDYSTVEWLGMVARRRERAQLLVIGTYRPVDVIVWEHPLCRLKQDLQLHGQCEEVPLRYLTEEAVEEYLTVRFPGGATGQSPLQRLARLIHQWTEGNPLFMVAGVEELVR